MKKTITNGNENTPDRTTETVYSSSRVESDSPGEICDVYIFGQALRFTPTAAAMIVKPCTSDREPSPALNRTRACLAQNADNARRDEQAPDLLIKNNIIGERSTPVFPMRSMISFILFASTVFNENTLIIPSSTTWWLGRTQILYADNGSAKSGQGENFGINSKRAHHWCRSLAEAELGLCD